jgi:biopolymer transport protein ExbB/TolQ
MRVWFHVLTTTLIATLLVVVFGLVSPGIAQNATDSTGSQSLQLAAPDSSSSNQEAIMDPSFNQKKLYDLYHHAGFIGQVTMLVLAFGIFLIIRQAFQLRGDAKDSKWVLERIDKVKIDNVIKLKELEQLISQLEGAHNVWSASEGKKLYNLLKPTLDACQNIGRGVKSLFVKGNENEGVSSESAAKTTVFALFSKLYEVFKATQDIDGFNAELANYTQYLKDKFNPFLVRLSYLSDSAGALGLLGTVWGMFLTFFSGNMEQAEIVQGMGIALATTIIGIVVSLILNTCTTLINNKFDAHLEVISKMSNEFQIRLMRAGLVTGNQVVLAQGQEQAHPAPERRTEKIKTIESPTTAQPISITPEPVQVRRIPAVIEFLKADHQYQKAVINQDLPEPLMVVIKDQENFGLDGVTVTFEVDPDGGSLNGGTKVDYVQTSGGGIAKSKWKLGEKAGNKVVRVKADGLESKTLRFFAEAKPEAPSRLIEIAGNYQTGHPGEMLEKPFKIRVEDKFQNPIAGVYLNFKITEGSGSFQNSRGNETHIETNNDGIAEVFFRLGTERGSAKISCDAKNIKGCTLQVFAS